MMKQRKTKIYILICVILIVAIIACIVYCVPRGKSEPVTRLAVTFQKDTSTAQTLKSALSRVESPTVTFESEAGNTLICDTYFSKLYSLYKSQTEFQKEYPGCTELDWETFRFTLKTNIQQYTTPSKEFIRVRDIATEWYGVTPTVLPNNAMYNLSFQSTRAEWDKFFKDLRHTDELAQNEMALQATVTINGDQLPSIVHMMIRDDAVNYYVYVGNGTLKSFQAQETLICIHHPSTTDVVAHAYVTLEHLPSDDELYCKMIIGE